MHVIAIHRGLLELMTWSVLAVEAGLALCWLLPIRWARLSVIAGVGLHVGIGLFLGLGNFALVMLAALACIWPSPVPQPAAEAPAASATGGHQPMEAST
jgi:hypothetical protein